MRGTLSRMKRISLAACTERACRGRQGRRRRTARALCSQGPLRAQVHAVKNPKTALYKACAELRTRLRFGLTGTAMQNNYEELYYMLDMCARRPRRARDSTKLLLCGVSALPCWVRVPAAGDELPVDAWTGATICVRVRFTQPYAYRRIVPSKLGDSYKLFKGYYVEALQQGQKRTSNDLELARVSQPSSLRSHPAAHARAACLRSDARRAGR